METRESFFEIIPPEAPQKSLKKNKKLFSDEHIKLIIEALKDKPNGRYEKKRAGKKSGEISKASITIQDILKDADAEELHGVIKLDNKFYAVSETIGKGTFGKAKLAQDLETGEWVVIKIQETNKKVEASEDASASKKIGLGFMKKQRFGHKREIEQDEVLEKVKMEIETLEAMQQGTGKRDVIQRELERSGVQKIQCIIVMKYIHGDTARDLIQKIKNKQVSLSPEEQLKIAFNFLKVLHELRNKGYYHCDINLNNIKINPKTWEVKLLDYGNASPIAKPKSPKDKNLPALNASPMGTRGYRSPEATSRPTEKSEVFSAGVVLAQIFGFAELVGDPLQLEWKPRHLFKDAMLQEAYDYIHDKMTAKTFSFDDEDILAIVEKRPTMDEAESKFDALLNAELKLNNLSPLSKFSKFAREDVAPNSEEPSDLSHKKQPDV